MKRAINAEQKIARRQVILETALAMYNEGSFHAVTVAEVARRSGIAKGTVYLYFKTKEEIFLALHARAYESWFGAMEAGLAPEQYRTSIPRIAALFAETLSTRPEFVRLLAILHTTLEQNIDPETARSFMESLNGGFRRIGTLLERNLDFLKPGEGTLLLVRVQALIIGLQHLAAPSAPVAQALQEDDLEIFRLNLTEGLKETLTILLMGLKARMKK